MADSDCVDVAVAEAEDETVTDALEDLVEVRVLDCVTDAELLSVVDCVRDSELVALVDCDTVSVDDMVLVTVTVPELEPVDVAVILRVDDPVLVGDVLMNSCSTPATTDISWVTTPLTPARLLPTDIWAALMADCCAATETEALSTAVKTSAVLARRRRLCTCSSTSKLSMPSEFNMDG